MFFFSKSILVGRGRKASKGIFGNAKIIKGSFFCCWNFSKKSDSFFSGSEVFFVVGICSSFLNLSN